MSIRCFYLLLANKIILIDRHYLGRHLKEHLQITFWVYLFTLKCKSSIELEQTRKNSFIFVSVALPAVDLKLSKENAGKISFQQLT